MENGIGDISQFLIRMRDSSAQLATRHVTKELNKLQSGGADNTTQGLELSINRSLIPSRLLSPHEACL